MAASMTVGDMMKLLAAQDPTAELLLNLGDDQMDIYEPAQVGLQALEINDEYQPFDAERDEEDSPRPALCLHLHSLFA